MTVRRNIGSSFYSRERWPYAADRRTIYGYSSWLGSVDWQFFCTFTFATKVSDPEAIEVFKNFINQLEAALRCDVSHVCGAEKRLSDLGRPASGRHFHVVLKCAASVSPRCPNTSPEITILSDWIEWLWKKLAGAPSSYDNAKVERYDPTSDAVSYLLKFINQAEGDWTFRKLHLVHPQVKAGNLNSRQRRNIRRDKYRIRQLEIAQLKAEEIHKEFEKLL